eukprot:14563764-Alexandrium_andersonii.AAC.1
MQSRPRHLELALRGPRKAFNAGTRSCRRARSALFLAQTPNLLTKQAGERAGGASWCGGLGGAGPPLPWEGTV